MENIIVVSQIRNNKSLPFLIDNNTNEKIKCMENEERIMKIIDIVEKLPFVHIETPQLMKNDLMRILETIHTKEFIAFLNKVSNELEYGKYILEHPYTNPYVENDTPIVKGFFEQAFEAAMTALYSGYKILNGAKKVYSINRPPGHHAGKDWIGGYCYLNNAAVALKKILDGGIKPVGLLDIDFHFGDGSANILLNEPDALFISIHADTEKYYPYTKINEVTDRQVFFSFSESPSENEYIKALDAAIERIIDFGCKALVVSVGFDIIKGDPHGTWNLSPMILKKIGVKLKSLGIPLCFIQEGGYLIDEIGYCACQLLEGLK